MKQSIQIENLSTGYRSSKGGKVVAFQLNAGLNNGELTCLLGANGTGKSTLIKTISGFLKSIEGRVTINGSAIEAMNEKDLAKQVAVVLTEKINVPNATVYELVAYGRSPHTGFLGRLSSDDKQIIEQAIEQCGIADKRNRLVSSLSDGERQKATIAKALAQDTPIIILDEPTAFLDLPARVEVMQLLRKLAVQTGKSILMSTHDLDLALQMADRLWLLQTEAIISGTPEDLLLQNAFQSMFKKDKIEFDNKTGMFKVAHQYNVTVPVAGHGFEYVLLRRALMRKGIKPVKANEIEDFHIRIINDSDQPFEFWYNQLKALTTNKVEDIVSEIMRVVSHQNIYN
nr:ABC transporter ATP-binding protein [uncultured Carboxylicivirga sp.]